MEAKQTNETEREAEYSPDLTDYLDLFNRVSEITIDSDQNHTTLAVKLQDGQWSFCVFYDQTENPLKKENHERMIKSLSYYLGEM